MNLQVALKGLGFEGFGLREAHKFVGKRGKGLRQSLDIQLQTSNSSGRWLSLQSVCTPAMHWYEKGPSFFLTTYQITHSFEASATGHQIHSRIILRNTMFTPQKPLQKPSSCNQITWNHCKYSSSVCCAVHVLFHLVLHDGARKR